MLLNHSRKYFNTSITILSIHTEGVITDFVRTVLRVSRYRALKVANGVKDKLEKNREYIKFKQDAFNNVIEVIEQAFKERFDCVNPDKASNSSRDKIAHGHVCEKET